LANETEVVMEQVVEVS